MRLLRRYATHAGRDHYPSSSVRVYRKAPRTTTTLKTTNAPDKSPPQPANPEYAENLAKVQMISQNLHAQIFPQASRQYTKEQSAAAKQFNAELHRHGIDICNTTPMPDVQLKLPKLHGKNIEEHFYAIAKQQIAPYEALLQPLVECRELPAKPKRWAFYAGWTAYDPEDGTATPVSRPLEKGIVFDVEVCVQEGSAPVLATAVSTKRWYCWVSPKLTKHRLDIPPVESIDMDQNERPHYTLDELIPLGSDEPGLVVGHNVSYDRARLREQYLIEDTGTRFVDTMSLHMCVSGVTSYQRALLKSKKEPAEEDLDWLEQSALNNLVDVHRLYCDGKPLSKEPRNIFVEGTLEQVRQQFQSLVNYCANDVEATHRILCVLYPLYASRFPHPVTLAGMLEMGSAYLPVNSNWERYIRESQLTYEDVSIEAKYHLGRRAEEACALLQDEQYRQHLWLWDEDWSVQQLKLKQQPKRKKPTPIDVPTPSSTDEFQRLQEKFQYLYDQRALLPARRPLLPGYPQWYRKLCRKPPAFYSKDKSADEDEPWTPGASEISTGMKIAPKLLSLCWEGYPLHYQRENGWGFLVPFRRTESNQGDLPIEQLLARCSIPEFARMYDTAEEADQAMDMLPGELDRFLGKKQFYKKVSQRQTRLEEQYKGSGVWCNQVLDDCCFFLKLPHKNGPTFRVGNPLSKDFLNKFSENALSSGDPSCQSAARVIEIARMMSYWRNNRDRILNQMVVWLRSDELPSRLRDQATQSAYGAICPQVVVAGTLTRRAMESTWMTASNSRPNRIGSELRAMVQAPPGYKLVGADVDSQELWIASVLGDAYACGEHGATPLGWMTLSGSKSNGSDMHSTTAKVVGISRDHAKVLNYARIYGAGQQFAETLLQQFNPTLSASEAKAKAMKMFAATKGKRVYRLRDEFHDELEDRSYSSYEASRLARQTNRLLRDLFHRPMWQGGTESAMFNRLEEIATRKQPETPFLGCRLSRALESHGVEDQEQRFLPTRVNWVVQSGAVDFLHLMLVCMRWLLGSQARFCLSFHDEVRYLVKDDVAYKAALAMHVTNLLTRSFCASRIGLTDLPMSVAFFASVEVDTVLRKECTMDCQTPSNPHGLKIGYDIAPGETLSITEAIKKAGGEDLSQWDQLK